jgi:hypothetical protein
VRTITVGKRIISLWLIAVILVSAIGVGALGYYVWKSLTIPLEVKEPIEILGYPSQLSLYPGETEEFNITLQNRASVYYSIALDFHLSNATYQTNYVTFSDDIYIVTLGQQNLTAWVMVEPSAPPLNVSLTIDLKRGVYPSGLVGYWKFNEGSGTVALDSSKNDNYGILHGATWTSGKVRYALKFDGVDDYVEVPILYSSSPSSLTVSAWINSTLSDIGYIVYHGDDGEFLLHNGERIFENGTGGRYPNIASFSGKLADGYWYNVYSAPMTSNVWHHLVGVWIKGVSLKIYVDGVLAGENTAIPNHYLFDPNPPYLPSIGVYSRAMREPETFFDGTIDEVRIYNRALSVEEVEALYANLLP